MFRRHRTPTLLVLLMALGAPGCEPPVSHPGAGAPEDAAYAAPRAESVPQRTTPGDVAIRNLNARIDEQLDLLARRPQNLEIQSSLVFDLLTRTRFVGSYLDFDTVQRLTQAAVASYPERPEPYLLRAAYAGATHRFSAGAQDLDVAERLGASDVDMLRAGYDIAVGADLEWARELRRSIAERAPTFKSIADHAAAEAALGNFERADELYLQALAYYRDVSPLPVAWLMFQRGVMWSERANDPERALPLYVESVYRVPEYVPANVHLAELEWAGGHETIALDRLRRFADTSQDPEPSAVLAKLLLERAPSEAARYAAAAREMYDALLARHPEAFWDHAAEFFMNAGGDPARAVELSLLNLNLRQTGRAYQVAIRAAVAARDDALLCRVMFEAMTADRHDRNLDALVAEQAHNCGQQLAATSSGVIGAADGVMSPVLFR